MGPKVELLMDLIGVASLLIVRHDTRVVVYVYVGEAVTMRSGWPHPPARNPLLETVLPLRKSCDSKNITILQTCVSK